MQAELQALQPQLIKTVAEVAKLMEEIATEKATVVEPKAAIVTVGGPGAQGMGVGALGGIEPGARAGG